MTNKSTVDAVGYEKILMVGCFYQWHMVVIYILCSLFVTSQFDVIFMFPH